MSRGVFEQAIFETTCTRADASIVVIPVCYDGTASYRKGTRLGPAAIMQAYEQLDYEEPRFPVTTDAFGVFVDQEIPFNPAAKPNSIGAEIRSSTNARAMGLLQRSQIPAILGGEHSVSQGAIEACAAYAGNIGVLQIDAHMDLRNAYEGYTFSHASVMRNIVDECPQVTRLVQVGIRDYCSEERDVALNSGGRVHVLRDDEIFARTDAGESIRLIWEEAVALLPDDIYITFDIDGLDPSLCPSTSTPVPGGLNFNQAALLLQVVAESGKRVVGFDLVEVAPSPDENEWDANVGARVLYMLCRCAFAANRC